MKQTSLASVIEEEVVDAYGKSQLSSFLLNVTRDSCVQELFIIFSDVSENCSAASLSRNVFDVINEFHCSEKLVAQT